MSKSTVETRRFVGLDVHADTIAVAIAQSDGEVRSLGGIPNRPESVRKALGKLGDLSALRACYEAGPTGYALYWQLTALGVACTVVAPLSRRALFGTNLSRSPRQSWYRNAANGEPHPDPGCGRLTQQQCTKRQ